MDEHTRANVREIARRHLAGGDPLGWFEEVYQQAAGDPSSIPWASARPNPNLVGWLESCKNEGMGQPALVIGCGLGEDAEELARRGFVVTAFDIAPASIAWCRRLFPETAVEYQTADLFQAPQAWMGGFDFIYEAYTLQSMPSDLRRAAMNAIPRFLRPGGVLLVVALGRDPQDSDTGPPWPLTREELGVFQHNGLAEVSFEDYLETEDPPTRRFRVTYCRRKA